MTSRSPSEQDMTPSPEQLAEFGKALSEVASHPEFTRMLREIERAPEAERVAKATQLASVDELAKRGVPIPDGFRLTTRFFENPEAAVRGDVAVTLPEPTPGVAPEARTTVCGSIGYIVCGSVGGEVQI
jgi:hypothetical protein